MVSTKLLFGHLDHVIFFTIMETVRFIKTIIHVIEKKKICKARQRQATCVYDDHYRIFVC